MNIPRSVILDEVKFELLQDIQRLEQTYNLSVFDVESILYQIMCGIKEDKESTYSTKMIELINKVQKLEAEKKNPNTQIIEEVDNGQG